MSRSQRSMPDHISISTSSTSAGEVDVQMLTQLQSELPDVSIRAEIVEGSVGLISSFRGRDPGGLIALVCLVANIKSAHMKHKNCHSTVCKSLDLEIYKYINEIFLGVGVFYLKLY